LTPQESLIIKILKRGKKVFKSRSDPNLWIIFRAKPFSLLRRGNTSFPGNPLALPRMKSCTNGPSKPSTGRATITRSTRLFVRGARPSPKCRGPVTQNNPDPIAEFQATCRERLPRVIPAENTRPVRVFSQDESRCGLLTARSIQPVGPVQHLFKWFYVYGAVAPTTGERFFLELPYLDADYCVREPSIRI
jgi:hypothetical protein